MKKSFLKRVAAAAVAVPVALTQTAVFTSFAAGETENEATKISLDTFVAVTTDTAKLVKGSNAYKAKEAAYENAYVQESTWNEKIKAAVNSQAGSTYEIDAIALLNSVESNNKYINLLKSVSNEAESTATVEITRDKIIVTIDMALDVAGTLQGYADENLKDFPNVELSFEDMGVKRASMVLTADVKDLGTAKEIPFTAAFGDGTTAMSLTQLVSRIQATFNELENGARATVADKVDEYRELAAEKQAEKDAKQAEKDDKQKELDDLVAAGATEEAVADAQAKLDDAQAQLDDAQAQLDAATQQLDEAETLANTKLDELLNPIKNKVEAAQEYVEKAAKERHAAYTAENASDLYDQVREDAVNSRFNDMSVNVGGTSYDVNDIPATLTDALNSNIYGTVANYFTKALAMVNDKIANTGYQIDITVADLETKLQEAYDLDVAANTANYVSDGNAFFYLPDEDADLTAYTEFFNEQLAADELEVDEIFSVKAVEADGNADVNTWNGDASLNIYRVVWYTTKDLEDPSDTDPSDTDPSDTDPSDTDPSDTDPSDTDPSDTDPSDTDPSDTDPTGDSNAPEIDAEDGFFFAHDPYEFEAEEMVTVVDEAGNEIDYDKFSFGTDYTAPVEGLNPKQVYDENVDGDGNTMAYAWKRLYVFYDGMAARDAEGHHATAYVYIGVKGDADLNGVADASDAAAVLIYAAAKGAGDPAFLTTTSDTLPAGTETLENFAYFLADTDTESTVGAAEGVALDSADATNILIYAAIDGANQKCDWIPEVLSTPYPKYSEQIAIKAGLID